MIKVEEIIEIGIKAHFAAGFGDLKYISKEIAQALSSANLLRDEVDEQKLGEIIFPYVAKCWLPQIKDVIQALKSVIESGEVWKR